MRAMQTGLCLWDGTRQSGSGMQRRVNEKASSRENRESLWPLAPSIFVSTSLFSRPLNCVAFNPNSSNVIATGSWDSAIRMWDVFHKKRVAVRWLTSLLFSLSLLYSQVLRGHQTSVRDLAFSPCGSYVASAALDGEVKLWSSFNGTQVPLVISFPLVSIFFFPGWPVERSSSADQQTLLRCLWPSAHNCL